MRAKSGRATVTNLEWVDQAAALNYRIGDFQVGVIRLPVRTPKNYFLDLGEAVDLDHLEPSRDRGVLLRSLPIAEKLPRFRNHSRRLQYVPRSYRRYLTNMNMTAELFLGSLSGKSRNTLRRKKKKLEAAFEIRFREYKTVEELSEYFDAARTVSQATYQERLLDFGLPEEQEFLDRTRTQARTGNWRGYVLFADGAPIAYVHCPLHDGVAFYAYVGFIPSYSQWSPGTVLQWMLMERMFEDPAILSFDFTEGEGPHKAFFSTDHILCADVWLFSPTARNWLIVLSHGGLDAIGVCVGRFLNRFGLKSRTKKLLRRQ